MCCLPSSLRRCDECFFVDIWEHPPLTPDPLPLSPWVQSQPVLPLPHMLQLCLLIPRTDASRALPPSHLANILFFRSTSPSGIIPEPDYQLDSSPPSPSSTFTQHHDSPHHLLYLIALTPTKSPRNLLIHLIPTLHPTRALLPPILLNRHRNPPKSPIGNHMVINDFSPKDDGGRGGGGLDRALLFTIHTYQTGDALIRRVDDGVGRGR